MKLNTPPKSDTFKRIEELKSRPFFRTSHSTWTKADYAMSDELDKLEEKVKRAAAKLKPGDTVEFSFTTMRKNKRPRTGDNWAGMDFIVDYHVGKVVKTLYNKKRAKYGETVSIPTIKCMADGYVYECSPDSVIKF